MRQKLCHGWCREVDEGFVGFCLKILNKLFKVLTKQLLNAGPVFGEASAAQDGQECCGQDSNEVSVPSPPEAQQREESCSKKRQILNYVSSMQGVTKAHFEIHFA